MNEMHHVLFCVTMLAPGSQGPGLLFPIALQALALAPAREGIPQVHTEQVPMWVSF